MNVGVLEAEIFMEYTVTGARRSNETLRNFTFVKVKNVANPFPVVFESLPKWSPRGLKLLSCRSTKQYYDNIISRRG